jgi:Flp pilus assembly pilin Flp
MNKLSRIVRDQRGASFVEYLILVGVIAIVGILAFRAFGTAVSDKAAEFEQEVRGL